MRRHHQITREETRSTSSTTRCRGSRGFVHLVRAPSHLTPHFRPTAFLAHFRFLDRLVRVDRVVDDAHPIRALGAAAARSACAEAGRPVAVKGEQAKQIAALLLEEFPRLWKLRSAAAAQVAGKPSGD